MVKDLKEYTKDELIQIVKSLKERKKFGLVWEDKPEQISMDCQSKLPILKEVSTRAINMDDDQPTNLIIEGDNYHALSVLNYTHSGKVDVIYIDPPYNTGAKDWKYNNNYVDDSDVFRHSKWLSMMEKRLILAKNLLKDDGVLICAIDENELHTLGLLLKEIFPDNGDKSDPYESHCITIVHNPRGIQGTNFSYVNEYALFIIPKNKKVIGNRKINIAEVDWRGLRDNGGESLRTDARNCFYPIIIKNEKIVSFGDVSKDNEHPLQNVTQSDGSIWIYPIDKSGIERKWRYARQSVEKIQHLLRAKKTKDVYNIELGKDFGTYRTVWQDARYDSNEYGKKIINDLVPDATFDFPKSLWNVYDCIYAVVGEKKEAIILDFFAGSGTTGHAVLELNKEDSGNRQFILCTNNENKIAEDVTYQRLKTVITGQRTDKTKYNDSIPANIRYFKTDFVSKSQTSDKLKREIAPLCTDMIKIRENCFESIIETDSLKVFRNNRGLTAIIFDQFELAKYITEIEKIKTSAPVHLYVFSYDSNNREFEMPKKLKNKYISCPIPEGVLAVYRRIFKIKGNINV